MEAATNTPSTSREKSSTKRLLNLKYRSNINYINNLNYYKYFPKIKLKLFRLKRMHFCKLFDYFVPRYLINILIFIFLFGNNKAVNAYSDHG